VITDAFAVECGAHRVCGRSVRGFGHYSYAWGERFPGRNMAARRDVNSADERTSDLGFRLAASLPCNVARGVV